MLQIYEFVFIGKFNVYKYNTIYSKRQFKKIE